MRQKVMPLGPLSLAPGASGTMEVEPFADTFHPRRLVLSTELGPVTDVSRFYAIRTRQRRPKARRQASFIAAARLLRLAQGERIEPHVVITDVRVGVNSQFVRDSTVPAFLFAPTWPDVGYLNLDPVKPKQALAVHVTNDDGMNVTLMGAVFGLTSGIPL